MRVIAVEEHTATEAFLRVAHGLDVVPGDQTERDLTHTAGAATPMPRLSLTPSEYFRRNFVITTSGIDDPDVPGLALRAVGEDNAVLAIDCPYEDPAAAMAFLRDTPLTDGQRTAISPERHRW